MDHTFKGNISVIGSDVLDHLGIIAATINKLGIVDKIDKLLPISKAKGAKLTHGQRVAAMIMNGLGFINDRLYMFPKFLANKPVTRLFGEGINASDFNDDCLGRSLDAIHDYGVTTLYSNIAFEIAIVNNLMSKTHHLYTTSLTLFGEYEEQDEVKQEQIKQTEAKQDEVKQDKVQRELTAKPAYGNAKNKRFDLKQMTLLLATTGKSNFPIWMESHSGNTSDKISLQKATERMQTFFNSLKESPSFLYVADSAMYSSCVNNSNDLLWLSRVPNNISECKNLISLQEVAWMKLDENYKIYNCEVTRKNIKQRWCLVYSALAYNKEIKTLEKNIATEEYNATVALWHISNQEFGCKQDIYSVLNKFKKTIQYHIVNYDIEEVAKYNAKGRPKKDAEPTEIVYKINSKLEKDQLTIDKIKLTKGRFVLATNQLDMDALPDNDILAEYKAQSGTESGFKFIKDDSFEVDSIFLKKPSRINALMMVMTLCLMVYGYAQFFLRQQLISNNDTIISQTDKPTNKPSMQWVYRMFHGITVVKMAHNGLIQTIVLNLTDELKKIIKYFNAHSFYDIEITESNYMQAVPVTV